MPRNCIIKKDDRGRITRVETPTGQRSTLFDKLMGMAPVSDARKAAKAMMTVYGDRFKDRFGDWERRPVVRDDLRRLRFRLRRETAPTRTGIGYKVFVLKDGKLYPPMVANPGGADTPVGVWLDADAAPVAGTSKTGRPQVKAGGKGTQGGSGTLAYRPGWHLGLIPYAKQFNRKDPETGQRELFPSNFVWAEVEYAADVDYQEEATAAGTNAKGKYQHSLAGLKRVPKDGFYMYRTNPDPSTDDWVITGAMRVKRILRPSEVDAIVREAGREPQRRQEGAVTDEDIDKLNESLDEDKRRFRFIGEKGADRIMGAEERKTALDNLSIAKALERIGKEMREIWRMTGWMRRGDGKWRYEMPDSVEYTDKFADSFTAAKEGKYREEIAFRDIFKDSGYVKEWYSEYPDLEDMEIDITYKPNDGYRGEFNPDFGLITLNAAHLDSPEAAMRTLIHELQHFIQFEEGFAPGGNERMASRTADFKMEESELVGRLVTLRGRYDATASEGNTAERVALKKEIDDIYKRLDNLAFEFYRRLMGEVEARNAATRAMTLSPEEIRARVYEWSLTEDVDESSFVYLPAAATTYDAVSDVVDDIASPLGVEISKVMRGDIEANVEDPALREAMLDSKGWYDPATDTITVVVDNIESEADAQATILHEAIAHKGMRRLLGDRFVPTMEEVYRSMPEADQTDYLARYGDVATAAEEWLGTLSETYVEPSLLDRIVAIIRDALRAIGIDLKMNDADIANLLKRSKDNLSRVDDDLSRMDGMANERAGLTYPSGEPRLFYRSDGGKIKGSYQGAASSSPTGKVTAGFVSGRTTGDDPDVTMEGDDITIKNNGEFIPAMTVDATADVATRAGYVNYLVRKGLLSGERVYRDGEYLLTGAGSSGLTRLVNASNAVSMLKARFGGRSAQINAFGEISFDTEADTDTIETVGRDGSDVTISRSEAEEMIRQGRYNELDRRIEDAGEIAATMALDEARKRAVGAKPLDRRMRDEEASIRASLMDILSSLGVRVIGMKEYVDGYAARNGVPLSVRALADTANMVVALAEGATVEDLAEETAHFLIDTYRNQAEIDAILPSVRGTEEWSKYSGRYYHLYGRDYEGAELDRMVEREILGKILSRKFTRGMNTDLDAMERSNDGHISLLGRIIRAIRNFLTNQRDRLDRTLERVRDYALSGEMGVFDPSLVSVAQRVMYSADDVRYAKRLMKAKRGLERTFHNLRRMELSRTALLGETVRTLKETEAALSAAKDNEDAMNKHSVVSAMQSVISTAEAQVRYLINSAKALRRSDNLDFDILRAADEVYNGIVPLLKELIGLVNDSPSGYFPDGGSMLTRMRSAMATAENARADIDEARRRNMDGYLDRFFDKYNIEERHRKIIKELVGSVMRDVGYISRFFGTLEHSSNPILSMLGYMLSIVAQKARREAIRRVDPMLRLISEKKFTISDYRKLIKKRGDKYTMFLMAGRDVALYDLNMRRAEAEALIDIYSLERVHDNMTREDMINAIISDKGFETERIIRRPDVDENGEPKRDAEGNVVMKDVRLGQKVRLMANGRPMDYTVMEVTERTELDELMDRWHEENDERPYKEEYYEMVRRVEAEFRKSNDGKDMSPDTRAFLRRIRADRDAVYARFAKPDGSTDWEALSKDSLATSTLDDIATDRRWAKSEKNKDGSDKSDEERRLAEEISLWDRLWSKELGERGQGRLSREILSIVSSIQRERGPKAAMDFLLSGAKVGFKEEVWGESLAKRIKNRWEEYSSKVNPGEKDIKMISDAREIAARLDDTRREIRAILSNYRTGSRYGEYDVTVIMNDPTVRLRLMDLYSGAETMRRKLLGIARYFDVQGLEMEGLESDTSQSYKDAYDDAKRLTPGLREHEFALRLMSPQRSKALRMLGEKLRRGNVTGLTPFEKRFLEKELGADYESVVAEIGKEAKDEVELTDTIQDILDSYSRLLVPSYCKLSSPTGFSVFQDKMESGEIDVVRMLSDMESGMTRESSVDVYGFDINTLRLDFNTRWLDNDKRLESMRNPDYDTSLGYGSRIPRKSKYTDKEYYSFFGIDEGNERMEATRNKDLWELRKTFLDIADQVMTDYNDRWRGIYMLPQLSKGMTERFHTSFGSVGNAVRNYLKDVAGERIDDPMYGQRVEGAADGARQVPKYYVYRLEDSDDVSHDLGYSYGMLALQGARYKEKSEALSDVMGQETLMRQAEFEGGKNPEATRAMRQMTDWIDAAIYDVRMNGDKIEWNVGGHRVNVAKLLSTITKVISSFNIGFSHVVALTGALTGNTNLMIEGALGSYVDKGSLKFGMAEARRQLPKFMSEVGELDRRNKLYVLGERAGLFNVSNRIRSTAYNKIWRTMFRDMPFKLMEILNTPLDLAIIGAVTKDIRLFKINEGKENERLVFGSFNEFKADRLANGKGTGATSVRDEWDSIADQSLYDLIDTSDGDIKATRPELQEMVDKYFDTAAVRMRSMSQVVGGYLNDDNRVSASRNMILNLVLQHRGWLILYAQRAYKRRGINHFTGEEEEGYINTYLNFIRSVFKTARDGRWSETLKVISEEYHKLKDFEKRNIRRGVFDFGVLVAFNILSFALLGYMDDDDDDWLAQYTTLVVSRYMNEMVGQGGVAMIPGMVDAFQEPFVIARKMGDIMNIPAWVGTVDSGVYKGYPAWVRQVMKLTWGKQLFNYMTPADIRQTYEYWYLMNKMTMGLASGWPKAMMSED